MRENLSFLREKLGPENATERIADFIENILKSG